MTDPRPGDEGGQFPPDRYRDPEAQLGGADAVEKTSYVTGKGTSPEARRPKDEPAATVPARGFNAFFWLVLAIVVLLVIAYVAGLVR